MTDRPLAFVIAVVDDDRRILESLESLLESADYGVRLFPSAKPLMESGCLTDIDLLISDICMPEMDGFDLLRVVHADRPKLPIIIISGQPDMLHRLPPISTGPYRVFKKPFDGQELLTAVSDLLRHPRPRNPEL